VDGQPTDTIVDPMEPAVAKDGRVFWAERKGVVEDVRRPPPRPPPSSPPSRCSTAFEEGMLGITLDPNFLKNGWI
jgi:hypothetical protein